MWRADAYVALGSPTWLGFDTDGPDHHCLYWYDYRAPASIVSTDSGISAPARFNGTPDQAKLVLQIFFLLIGFGIAITLNGIIQVSTGQRNRIALFFSLGIAALIVITGYGIVRPI
ncbi:MAG: hypothetical protein IPF48_04160 [Sphingomonadales bacterium]|nr:hypothetical protein [Sphingomonadales bacterium]